MAERETHIEMLSLKQSGMVEKIFDTLEKSMSGDYDAMQEVISLFKPYMTRLSMEDSRFNKELFEKLVQRLMFITWQIALLTRHEIGTVERAIRVFMQLGFVEVLEDNTYYMPEIQEMTGKGLSDAKRKARYRRLRAKGNTPLLTDKNVGMGQNRDNILPVFQFCPPENIKVKAL